MGSSAPGPKCPSLTVNQAQVSQSHSEPGPCPSPTVNQTQYVPLSQCIRPNVSQSHSEPGPICPTLTVYQAQCVPVPQCTRPNVSQTYSETGPMRSNPRVWARVRVTQRARYRTRLVHTGCTPICWYTQGVQPYVYTQGVQGDWYTQGVQRYWQTQSVQRDCYTERVSTTRPVHTGTEREREGELSLIHI